MPRYKVISYEECPRCGYCEKFDLEDKWECDECGYMWQKPNYKY